MPIVLRGLVTFEKEDGGQAWIAELADGRDVGIFVRIQSWDQDKKHVEAQQLVGKRVRVEIHIEE